MIKEDNKYHNLTSSDRLGKNTLLNLTAKILPLFVGLFAIPLLIDSLGEERFGFLALIWLMITYFSMFNLGMSPAIVRLLSEKIAKKEFQEIPKVVWTGIVFITIMGIIAGVLLFSLSGWFTYSIFEIEEPFREEVYTSLVYISFAIPLIICASGFKAVMESLQKFKMISFLQGLNSLLNYLLPLLIVLYLQNSLVWVILSLLFVKVFILILFIFTALKAEPRLKKEFKFNYSYLKEMIGFGKWVTVSNILGPLMGQLDRYFIGAFLSISAVTYYTTPLEILSKVMIIPSSAVAVLFPAFSTLSGSKTESSDRLFIQSTRAILVLLFPALLVLSLIAPLGLNLWLGEAFEQKSTLVAQVFCIVFFVRGAGYILTSFLHGLNRPDLTAKFHLIEVFIFALSLYYISGFDNINYIAFVALGITILDTILLLWAAFRKLELKKEFTTNIIIPLILGAFVLGVPMVVNSIILLAFILLIVSVLFIKINYTFALKVFEKIVANRQGDGFKNNK